MEEPRPRFEEEPIIILEKQPLPRFLMSLFFTILIWLYSVMVVWFFASAMFNMNDKYSGILKIAFKTTNSEIRTFVYLGIGIFLVFLLYFIGWRTYNKHRFGNLSRRRSPKAVTAEDFAALGLLPRETIKKLQSADYIEFETNPVRDLEE